MRRSLVTAVTTGLLAVGGLALGGLATAGLGVTGVTGVAAARPATAVSAQVRPQIVCPLGAASPAATIPCCGPPVAGAHAIPCCPVPTAGAFPCCPPNAMCVAPATITAAPNPSVAGDAVKLSGRIVGAAGAAVALWQELPGQPAFTQVAGTTADSAGAYAFSEPELTTNREWYVQSGAARSVTLAQQVRPRLRLTLRVHRGRFALAGSLSPSHAGEQVSIERRVGAGWRSVATPRLDRGSRFAFAGGRPRRSSVVLRVAFAGDARNVAAASPPVRVGGLR